ncbi:MAG TPA: hypothetical protein VH298_09795, partial [Jatrophihabitans sp.]|nr:hypothetical protein [Jatrophihabitans sp.]
GTMTGLAGLRAGGGGLLRGVGSFLGTPGGMVTAGLGAAFGGYELYSHLKASRDAENQRLSNLDFADTLNRYRDEMGQAGIATHTLADAMKAASDRINQVGASTRHRATTVTDQDIAAAGPVLKWNDPKIQQAYRGQMGTGGRLTTAGIASIAGQVAAVGAGHGGMTPSDLQATKMDLLRQGYNRADVETILGQAGTSGKLTGQVFAGIAGGVSTAAQSYSRSAYERSVRGPGFEDSTRIGSGGVGSKPLVGAQGKQLLDVLYGAVGDQYTADVTKYGQGYAVGQEIKNADRAVRAAVRTGQADTIAATAKRMARLLTGGKETDYRITQTDLESEGGSISADLASNRTMIQGHPLSYWQAHNRMQRRTQQTAEYTMLQQSGATALMPFFDALHPGVGLSAQRAGTLAQRAIDQPENLSLQTRAVSAMVNSATAAGTSLTELAHQATKAGGAFAEGSQQQIMMSKVLTETQFRLTTNLQGATRSQTWQQTLAFAQGQANTNGNSQWAQQQREAGRATEQQVRG